MPLRVREAVKRPMVIRLARPQQSGRVVSQQKIHLSFGLQACPVPRIRFEGAIPGWNRTHVDVKQRRPA